MHGHLVCKQLFVVFLDGTSLTVVLSADQHAAAPQGGGTVGRVGREGRKVREPRRRKVEPTGEPEGQGNDKGVEVNEGVDGVPDFSMIIVQQLQNLLHTMLAQVGNQGSNQGDNKNQSGTAINENIWGDVRNVILNNGRRGCTYKEFLACNPKEYDGKGGAIVYTRWIEKMESVQDMSGCGDDKKVKYTAGLFVGKALTWWNYHIHTRSPEVAVSMAWYDFKVLMRKEFFPSKEMQKLETELWNHAMVEAGHAAYTDRFHELARLVPHLVTPESKKIAGTLTDDALRNGSIKKNPKKEEIEENLERIGMRENTGTTPKCTTCNSYHPPEAPHRTCFNCNHPGHFAKDCRMVPRNVNSINARNPTARTCYEYGSTDHFKKTCPRRGSPGPEHHDGHRAQGELGFSYKIEIASGQLVEIDKVIKGCKLEIEGHVFDINLIPFGSRNFDVIIGMDWLSNHKAEIICHEKIAAYSDQTRPNLTSVSTSWRHLWDLTLGITLRKMSTMANITPIMTTVMKNANKEKTPKEADAALKANILDFCKEHYEEILPVIMDKIRRDKRKEVHAGLDFEENPRKSRRVREGSQNSSAKTLPTRCRNPSERPKMRDRLKHNDEDVFDRLGHQRQSAFDRLSNTYSPSTTKSGPNEGNSRDLSHSRGRSHRRGSSSRDRPRNRNRLCGIEESYDEEDLSIPWTYEDVDPFTPQIGNFKSSLKTRMPNNLKTYDGTEDPKDHLKIFQAAVHVERWAMPTWYHMFNSTLTGVARVWFDELPPESIDRYKGLKADFLAYFMQQKKRMKGSPECMRISRFMHGVCNPELTIRLNKHVPKTVEEMMAVTTAFIQGETTVASKKKVHTPWKSHDQGRRALYKSMNEFNDSEVTVTVQRIVTICSTILTPTECAIIAATPKDSAKKTKGCYDNFKVAIHPDFPDQEITIEGTVSTKAQTKLCTLLKGNLDIFAWQPSDMTRVPQSIAEHRINNREGYSPVRVRKHDGRGNPSRGTKTGRGRNFARSILPRLDCYPLSKIDWKVESLCGYPFKCLLDAYKGYHQIQMAEQDEEKMTFHTSHGVYCYTKMPFDLKNTNATYQWLVDKAFDRKISHNLQIYVEDLVIKSHTETELLPDIEEMLRMLRKINMKLNPNTYVRSSRRNVSRIHDQSEKNKTVPRQDEGRVVAPIPTDNQRGTGRRLTSPEGTEFTYALRFQFTASNNKAEYEALIAGLQIAAQMGVHNVHVSVDTKLVANQVLGTYVAKEENMIKYLEKAKSLISGITNFSISQVPRNNRKEARKLHIKARQYELLEGILYRRSFLKPWLRSMEGQVLDSRHGLFHKVDRGKAVATITGSQVKKFVWDNIVCRFGLPREIVLDNVKHPQSNGLVERANRSLGEGIKARQGKGNKNWLKELPYVLWAHRTMIKSSNEDTPFSLTYRTEAIIPAENGMPTYRTTVVVAVHNNEELQLNLDLLKERRERAAIRKAKAKLKMTKYYNDRVRGVTFRPGDFVCRSNDASHAVDGGKLGPKWEGPYEVTKALGDGAYKLRSTNEMVLSRTWNITNLKKCYL
uniref:Reverse transcriptase domain-containing protein n=1 Tax=Tanacetum cinerariifolium TaxID=118510 RepID=A0A6L2KJL1_TANCI|nr:reverse transcriptase domain-containing protein [Tanacetum cinerariifolium]